MEYIFDSRILWFDERVVIFVLKWIYSQIQNGGDCDMEYVCMYIVKIDF